MTPAEIRSLYIETLARADFAHFRKDATWDEITEVYRQTWIPNAERAVDALAEAGLLPTAIGYRSAYEPDGTPLGYTERQLLTGWQRMPAPQPCQCAPDVCIDPAAADPASGCTRQVAE